MKSLIRRALDRLPYIHGLRNQVDRQGLFPAGHYYSPIPSTEEIARTFASSRAGDKGCPDIDFDPEGQLRLLKDYSYYYADLPFRDEKNSACRYYYAQDWFCHADAIFLYSFLRKYTPRRIVEVGSGFSSAVILDTADRFFKHQPDLTFVEPYPERLLSVLKPSDPTRVRIVASRLQDAPGELFTGLGPGDLLFVDSSHVVKCGSDVHQLMFEILPSLSPGVFVHFHDVFYPFEYPAQWLYEGRYWNESYLVRAFLAYNSQWSMCFFNDYVARQFKGYLEERMPLCLKNTGGSIYIQKRDNNTARAPTG